MNATPQNLAQLGQVPDRAEPATSTPDVVPMTDAKAAKALCRSLGATAQALMDVIDSETSVLRDGRPQAIEDLQADKIELSARYLSEMSRLKRHAEAIRQLASDDIENLKGLTQELGAKLLDNRDALADVLSVSERLIRTATMTAIAAQNAPSTYGRDGNVSKPPTQATGAISVNTAL